MRFKSVKLGISALALAASTGFAPAASAAVYLLDFSGNICGAAGTSACSNSSQIGQNYGDVAGEVDVSHRSANSTTNVTFESFLKFWAGNYGDLTNVVWGGPGPTGYYSEITFTPGAGKEIAILGFEAGCYQNRTSCQTLNYDINSIGGSAIAGGATPTLFPGHATLTFSPAFFSDGIVLRWGPDGYDTGLDNIRFEVRDIQIGAIPEASTWAMMLAGFGLAGTALRRRKTLKAVSQPA